MVGLLCAIDRRYELAAAAFGVAALVKSPIPFIVLVWLLVFAVATRRIRAESKGYVRIAAGALVGTIAAEVTRYIVTPPSSNTEEAFSASWYFGSLSQRGSADYWTQAGRRLVDAVPGVVSGVLLLVVVVVALVVRRQAVWVPVVASSVAYLAGWLIFPNLYRFHSYYSLPGIAMLLVGAGAAVGALVRRTHLIAFALVLLVPFAAVFGTKLSPRQVANFYDAARFAFRHESVMVLVEDPQFESGPAWGGLTETRMVELTEAEFQGTCEAVLAQYRAIVTHNIGPSCLDDHRAEASTIITVPDYTVWLFGG
jgi:hypothetical protein